VSKPLSVLIHLLTAVIKLGGPNRSGCEAGWAFLTACCISTNVEGANWAELPSEGHGTIAALDLFPAIAWLGKALEACGKSTLATEVRERHALATEDAATLLLPPQGSAVAKQ
jgi:hypothetical protein